MKTNIKLLPRSVDGIAGKPDPTPRINLSSLENVRHEMARVYRHMRSREIDHQDGTRLIYVLTSICKVLELEKAEKESMPVNRLKAEEQVQAETRAKQAALRKLTNEELDQLMAITWKLEQEI